MIAAALECALLYLLVALPLGMLVGRGLRERAAANDLSGLGG